MEALSIPRNSSGRGRVANARIDSILYALKRGERFGGRSPGGGGRGRGREAAAGASGGRRESGVAPSSLSNEEVEAVVAYVGMDEFGGVHAEVGLGSG